MVRTPGGEVELGVPFEIELALTNNSANTLKNVRVQLEFPDNILLVDKPDEKIISRGIGDMVNGRLERETFKVVAVPGESPNYKIKSTVYYVPASISASLQRRGETEVRVKIPEASLELSAPERVFSGEDFTAEVSYKNSLTPKDNNYSLELKINHPPELRDGEKNSWSLAEIDLYEGSAALTGNIELPDETSFSLTAELVMKILGKDFPIISNTKNITVNPSPLSFRVSPGSPKEAVMPGEELVYFLRYKNNASVPLEDVVISAKLLGEMFDLATLTTNGVVDVLSGTIVWSPAQIKELEILDPNEEGQVFLTIRVKEDYPAVRQDLILKVDARIESPTVPPPLNIRRTVNLSSLEVKVVPSGSE